MGKIYEAKLLDFRYKIKQDGNYERRKHVSAQISA